ncbi:hypothetical protein [Thermomonas sp.]|uniref:hypothetical protein n=1 Tax=Thermomonas sp. TaxID=1971895 RepID=UPI0035B4E717
MTGLPTQEQNDIYDWLTASNPRYRHASKLNPETLELDGLYVGDGETKQVYSIELHKLPALCLMANGPDWHNVPQLRRLEAHWLATAAGLEGRA